MRKRSDGNQTRDRIHRFILNYYVQHKYPPTVRDICAGCGTNSTGSMFYHLNILEQEGRIRKDAGIARGIIPLPENGGLA